jgi:hypothetical protein
MANDSEYDDQPINPVKNAIISTVIAVLLMAVATALYFHFGRTPPESAGSVTHVSAAPMPIQRQTEEGTDIPVTIQDQYLVFAQVHISNVSDKPLQIEEINADLEENGTTVADPKNPDVTTTTTKRSIAAANRDFNKLFELYPQFDGYKTVPIPDDAKIPPHQSIDGTAVFSFGIGQKEWDLRKGLVIHVEFDNNTSLTMQAP